MRVLSIEDEIVTKIFELVEPPTEDTLSDRIHITEPSRFDDGLLDVPLVILEALDQALC